jgi:signal transduction histidine kinase/DNA-binding NarL/FixJ family response regulator
VSDLSGLQLLRRIEEGVAGKSGEAFFKQIVREITLALNAHAAFTANLLPERRARMLAFWVAGRYEKCISYSLAGTPCEYVYKGQITAYTHDIANVFPVDRAWFEALGVRSYLGVPIVSETGEVHGHLAVMDQQERDWRDADVDVLRLFSLRTAVELERAQAHRALDQSNQALQRMNEQLSQEITRRVAMEQQLAAAKLVAEAANQAKSVFISQMSHELRTPLNGILGYAQLLRRAPQSLTEQQRDGLAIIERSGEHLLTLVNDLLDLARIEAGKLELRIEAFDLLALLYDIAELLRVRADRAGLHFSTELPTELPRRIRADPRALRQVLLNLLGNAVKFTNAGGTVALRVRTLATSTERCRLQIEVTDSGIGIATEQLQHIFEPFHRIEHGTRASEGTGLGLTISRRLIEVMQGSLAVVSTVDVGTTFTVELEVAVEPTATLIAVEQRRVCGYHGPRCRVLVADDDAVNLQLVSELLSSLGFELQLANDGASALSQLRTAPAPHLVISDLVMPSLDGMQLIRALRADPDTVQLPILAVSASASQYTSEEALATGANAFVVKPLQLDTLLHQIAQLLSLQWQYQSADSVLEPRVDVDLAAAEFALSRELADDLYHFAMLGDVGTLLERATEKLGSDPRAARFYQQLAALAQQYDTGALRRLLSTHR